MFYLNLSQRLILNGHHLNLVKHVNVYQIKLLFVEIEHVKCRKIVEWLKKKESNFQIYI